MLIFYNVNSKNDDDEIGDQTRKKIRKYYGKFYGNSFDFDCISLNLNYRHTMHSRDLKLINDQLYYSS